MKEHSQGDSWPMTDDLLFINRGHFSSFNTDGNIEEFLHILIKYITVELKASEPAWINVGGMLSQPVDLRILSGRSFCFYFF